MYAPILLLLTLARYSTCQRRIVEGATIDKPYAVYIVWDEWDNVTRNEYSDFNTICGGVLLTPNHVLTSKVCLYWHPIQYVVAGYNRYVPHGWARNDEEEECMQIAKRYITERHYKDVVNITDWFILDVAVATLDTPYDFDDDSFETKCSYKPTIAKIHFEEPKAGENVVLLGWGSARYHRPEHVDVDMNEDFLTATPTVVIDFDDCEAAYGGLDEVFKFCTEGPATIDVEGKYIGQYRRHISHNDTGDNFALTAENVFNNKTIGWLNKFRRSSTRTGACQNDHGGPVVIYVNGIEHVGGMITGYLVNSYFECVGPTLCTKFSKNIHQDLINEFI